MPAELSIVFIARNSAHLIDRALASLAESTLGLDIECVVVDNASADREELSDVCQRNRARLLLLHRNVGYGAAFNRGWRISTGRHVAVANPDLDFRAGSIAPLVMFLDEHERAGAVSPQLQYLDGTPQPTARRFPRLRYVMAGRRSPLVRVFPGYAAAHRFQYEGLAAASAPVQVEAVIGAFVVFRRAALEAVSGFDERYFMYAEDMDISRRLSAAGWEVYVEPRCRLYHEYGAVRRRVRTFSDYQRLRGLRRFLGGGRPTSVRLLMDIALAGYLSLSAVGWLTGLGEYERSWQVNRVGSR
jgi:N-acetylglucosaminyl-diphospho-decaprenol L-rhamnosyltransferase